MKFVAVFPPFLCPRHGVMHTLKPHPADAQDEKFDHVHSQRLAGSEVVVVHCCSKAGVNVAQSTQLRISVFGNRPDFAATHARVKELFCLILNANIKKRAATSSCRMQRCVP